MLFTSEKNSLIFESNHVIKSCSCFKLKFSGKFLLALKRNLPSYEEQN